jgi:hypothetical protein
VTALGNLGTTFQGSSECLPVVRGDPDDATAGCLVPEHPADVKRPRPATLQLHQGRCPRQAGSGIYLQKAHAGVAITPAALTLPKARVGLFPD